MQALGFTFRKDKLKSSRQVSITFDPEYEWQLESSQQVTVCLGACQGWGACEIADSLFSVYEERREEGKALFDIIAVGCLDRCATPVAVDVDGPNGSVRHSLLRPGTERELLEG